MPALSGSVSCGSNFHFGPAPGKQPVHPRAGIGRIDSGDLTYLSRKARSMLDEAGLKECRIVASNALDEYIIRDLINQGACIDAFGVGERLITSKSEPVFGGVYKLAAIEDAEGNVIPKIKVSENPSKVTTPHFKKVWRIFEKETDKAIADLITVYDEPMDETKPLELFDPDAVWKRETVENYRAEELLRPVFKSGTLIYDLPDIETIRAYCVRQIERQWDEVKRFENPHNYYVDLSQKLWDVKAELLHKAKT